MKQLKTWYFNSGRVNSRGKDIDFSDLGEPDEVVFQNLIDSTLAKKVGTDYQDQASPNDIVARVNIDKFTTPDNLPIVRALEGSSNIVTITKVLEGNKEVYQISAQQGSENTLVIDLTGESDGGYNSLMTLKANGALVKGIWYQFIYTCLHKIPNSTILNNDSSITTTLPLIPEIFQVKAISSTQLCPVTVKSLNYPEDIIHWRADDNRLVNENDETFLQYQNYIMDVKSTTVHPNQINYISPNVLRTGRVYYRKDTIKRVSTPYDFRSVVYIRKAVKFLIGNTVKYKNAIPLTIGVVSIGTIIVDGTNYYLCTKTFTSANTTISNYLAFFTKITIIISNKYIATNDSYIRAFTFNSINIEFEVDSTDFKYFRTFSSTGNDINAYNIEIRDFVPAYIEAITWEFYPDIVFGNIEGVADSNVVIEGFSYNMTITGGFNLRIGEGSKDIIIEIFGTQIGSEIIKLGRNSQYVTLLKVSKSYNLGDNSNGIMSYNSSSRINIENNNNSIAIINTPTGGITIGSGNQNLSFENTYGSFGNNNFIVAFNSCLNISLGNNNRNIYDSYSTDGSFDDDNQDVSLNAVSSLIEGISINRVGDIIRSSSLISIFTAGNNKFDNAKRITSNQDKSLLFVDSNVVDSEDITLTTEATLPLSVEQRLTIFSKTAYAINITIPFIADGFTCTVMNCDTVNLNKCFSDDGLFYIEGVFNSSFINFTSDVRHRINKVKFVIFENITILNGSINNLYSVNLKNLYLSNCNITNTINFNLQPTSIINLTNCNFTNLGTIILSAITSNTLSNLSINDSFNVTILGPIIINTSSINGTSNLTIKATATTTINNMTIDSPGNCLNPITNVASIIDATSISTLLNHSNFTALLQDDVVTTNYYLCGNKPVITTGTLTITPIKTIVA